MPTATRPKRDQRELAPSPQPYAVPVISASTPEVASLPDQQQWLRSELAEPGSMWREITLVAETTSTNADVTALAVQGAPAGTVLVAEHQSAGRGRLDRSWVAPPRAALAVSMLLRPTADATRWSWLPLLTGMALASTLVATGVSAGLKWPNDVMVGDRKIAGILTELVSTPDGPACVVGWGLNTRMTADQLPVPTATSLWLEGARTASTVVLLATMLRRFERVYAEWVSTDHDEDLREGYLHLCTTVGRTVTASLTDGEMLSGVATGVDDAGRLLVRTAGGTRAVAAGDVVHARPANR